MANSLPPPVFLPGEVHGQRSLAGYSSWGGKESDTFTIITPVSQAKAKLDKIPIKLFKINDLFFKPLGSS